MARASLKVDLSQLDKLAKRFDDPNLKTQLGNVVANDGITALVSQAIADNFRKEGPGWAPLKAQTIRQSVAKKLRKSLRALTDKEIERYEDLARRKSSEVNPNRQILRRTSLLFNTVTQPGYSGSNKSKNGPTNSGQNIRRIEGSNLIWGTNLIYAATHNYGRGAIPQREFLVIRAEWEKRLYTFALTEMNRIIDLFLEAKS